MRIFLSRYLVLLISVLLFFRQIVFVRINFRNQNSTLLIASGGQFDLNTAMTSMSGTINIANNNSNSLTGSNNILFTNGVLQTGNVSAVMNTSLSPTSTDTIALANGDIVDVRSGSVVQAITVANGATATILGQPQFSSAIALGDASSVLQLGITTPLNQNVTGVGTLKLVSDLIVQKNVTLPSLLNLNNNRLVMFGGTYSSALTVSGSGFIDLLGLTTLSAVWTIGTGTYTIVGNGNVLDLGTTGQITFNGTALYLSDLVIKNLSGSRLNGTGTIYLSNVTLDLSGAFTRSDGQFYVLGANCKLITNNYTFTMSGSGNNLTVDGVIFWYEQLNSTIQTSPFATASSATINLLNGGVISQMGAPSVGIGGGATVITATSNTFDRNYSLTAAGPMTFVNATPGTPKSMAVDGGGHWIDLPYKSGSFLILQGNVQLNFANTVLKNFYPAGISYGSSATITYGDGVRLELGADLTMASGDVAWTFTGNAEIDGNGATLTLNKSQGITITGAKTLTLKNMRIVTSTADAFKCLSSTAKIALQNVDLILTNDFSFSQGSLDVIDLVKIFGDSGTGASQRNFELSSSGLMTITNSAELFVGPGVNFKYNADPTGAANFNATKRKFLMSRMGSRLTLSGCSLETTNTGLALDQGTITIYDAVTVKTTANSYAQFEIGQNTNIFVAAGAVFNLNGLSSYAEPLPLLFGDSIVLQHNNYGGYLGFSTADLNDNVYPVLVGSISNNTRIYIEPGDTDSTVGSVGGLPIKSGDYIKLNPYTQYSNYTGLKALLQFFESSGSPVSSPRPPYHQFVGWISDSQAYYWMFQIYKRGGAVGDAIYKNDIIYVLQYYVNQATYWPAGTNFYYYMGSANVQYSTFGKETFFYRQTTSAMPSNLDTQLTWKVVEVNTGAYLTASPRGGQTAGNAQYNAVKAAMPAASLVQF